MKQRTNAGYTIIATIQLPNQEYVLGEKQTESKEPKYVTWYCANGKDYYHGHIRMVKIKPRMTFTNVYEKKLITVCKN